MYGVNKAEICFDERSGSLKADTGVICFGNNINFSNDDKGMSWRTSKANCAYYDLSDRATSETALTLPTIPRDSISICAATVLPAGAMQDFAYIIIMATEIVPSVLRLSPTTFQSETPKRLRCM